MVCEKARRADLARCDAFTRARRNGDGSWLESARLPHERRREIPLPAKLLEPCGDAGMEAEQRRMGGLFSSSDLRERRARDGDSSSGLPCAASTAARRAAWSVDGFGLWFRPGMNEVATPILGSSLGRGRRDAGKD